MFEDPIARRYFVMNFFDGIMTAFGIVIGGAVAIGNPVTLIKAGLGASMAIMVSGFFGAYMAEKTERRIELKELERLIMKDLTGTELDHRAKKIVLKLAAIDALSPFAGAIIPILPFFAVILGLIDYTTAIYCSLGISFIVLTMLGWYLGKMMEESPWKNAFVFVVGGIVVGLLAVLLEKLF